MVSRAQVSVEFLIITAISLTILSTAAIVLLQYTQASGDIQSINQAGAIGYELVDSARNVYVYGPGSFVTITANVPESVTDIQVISDSNGEDVILFEITLSSGVYYIPIYSDVSLQTPTIDPDDPGDPDYTLYSVANDGQSVRGSRTPITVTAKNGYVELNLSR